MIDDEGDRTAGPVLIETHPPLAIIRLNRATERNPLSTDVLEELNDAVSALITRSATKAIILTGTRDVFASGADIRELRRLDQTTAREFALRGQRLFQKITDAPQLTLAAINGYCMGGGLDLALACKLRFASANATFAHPGARLGIITGWGGTQRLPRLVGSAPALELLLTAKRLKSDEALRIGLVSRICDPVLEGACEFALAHSPE